MAMVVGAKKYDRYHQQQHDEQEHSFDVMQENGNLVRLPSKEGFSRDSLSPLLFIEIMFALSQVLF